MPQCTTRAQLRSRLSAQEKTPRVVPECTFHLHSSVLEAGLSARQHMRASSDSFMKFYSQKLINQYSLLYAYAYSGEL